MLRSALVRFGSVLPSASIDSTAFIRAGPCLWFGSGRITRSLSNPGRKVIHLPSPCANRTNWCCKLCFCAGLVDPVKRMPLPSETNPEHRGRCVCFAGAFADQFLFVSSRLSYKGLAVWTHVLPSSLLSTSIQLYEDVRRMLTCRSLVPCVSRGRLESGGSKTHTVGHEKSCSSAVSLLGYREEIQRQEEGYSTFVAAPYCWCGDR